MSTSPLDDLQPFDDARSAAQIEGLLQMLGKPARRVLDLGCGAGRVLIPLARAGHEVIGVERALESINACRATYPSARIMHDDFCQMQMREPAFDAVLCVGNTLMTVADVEVAADLLGRVARWLKPGGGLFVDDFPYDLWPELTEGNWQSGISEDGSMQMVWKPGDSIFALRQGDQVDAKNGAFTPADAPLRLWCEGSLRLLARIAGLSAPVHLPQFSLMRMDRQVDDHRGGLAQPP